MPGVSLEPLPTPVSPPPDPLRAEIDALRAAVERNDLQIDDLQVRTAEIERPWYRHAQTLIALFALLFSLVTTLTSAYWAKTQGDADAARLRQEEIHDAKTELRGLLQALAELTRRVQTLPPPGEGNGGELLQQSYAAEMSLLTNQAIAVADTIPDEVSSSEYLGLAIQVGNLGDFPEAGRLVEKAIAKAETPYDQLSANRTYGMFLFGQGDVEGGRRHMQNALDVWANSPDVARQAPLWPKLEDLITRMFWAGYEALAGNCTEATTQSVAATSLWQELAPPAESGLQLQYNDMLTLVNGCVPGLSPVLPAMPTFTPWLPVDGGSVVDSAFPTAFPSSLFPTPEATFSIGEWDFSEDWNAWLTPEAPFSLTPSP